jgi:hypothetical protein
MTFWKRAAVEVGVVAMGVWAVGVVTATVAVMVWVVVVASGCGTWELPTDYTDSIHPLIAVDTPLAAVKAESK